MSDGSGTPDWEDDDELIDLNELDDDSDGEEMGEALSEFQRSMFESKIIHTFISNAFEFGGANTLVEVLNHAERKMGWRTEIIADRNALDDYLFYRYGAFDEAAWEYYVNSDEFLDLTRHISFLSTSSMLTFGDRLYRQRSWREHVRSGIKKLLWKAFSSL